MNAAAETAEVPSEIARKHAVKVLLVDDQRMVGEAVRRMLLELPGTEFRFCANPETAIEQAIAFKPTVILQDLIMPDVDGLDMVRAFRAHAATAKVPLVVLSSKEEAQTKADAFAAGANDYLVKLPDKLELLARVAYHSEAYILRLERDEAFQAIRAQKELISQELTEAKNYVRSLLPPPIEAGEYVSSDWRFVPCTMLGGDAFGYHWLDEQRMAIYLLDVCGHGVGAALMSVSAMNVIRSATLPNTDFSAPAQVLSALNEAFPMARHAGRYFSMWYGVYDAVARTLTYASGGHPPALLVPVAGESKELSSTGMVVGVFSGATFEDVTVVVEPGSMLYVYSDGCYEIPLADGEMMEAPPFLRILEGCAASMGSLDSVVRQIQDLQAKPEFDDDVSLLEFRFF